MTEESGMSCAEFADVTTELALGVLTGRERAGALVHLDQCHACAAHVDRLTTTGERLIGLLPPSEPPPGFCARVLERLGLTAPSPRSARPRRRFSRRMLTATAAVAAAAGAALGGWGLHPGIAPPSAPAALSSAALLTAGHQKAGEVFVYNRAPHWMHVSVDLESGSRIGTVICQLESADGRVTTVGSFQLSDGYGSWGSPGWVGDGAPVSVRLLTTDGAVLATASFPEAAASR